MKSAHSRTSASASWPSGLILSCAAALGACSPESSPPDTNQSHEHEEQTPANKVALTPEAVASNGLRIEKAAKHTLRPSFRVPARIAFNPEGVAQVGSPVKGRISSFSVKLGDEVTAGSVLIVIESPEFGEAQSDYLMKQSAVLASAPHVELTRSAHERARALHDESQGIALSEVAKREADYVTAQSALRTARAAESAAASKLTLLGSTPESIQRLAETGTIDPHVSVRAPIAGQVIERRATLGELVGPDHEALLVLADVSRLFVSADVPESRLHDLVIGARARVLLGLEQDHWCEGTVAFISPALDSATRSVRVRIDVQDQHPELRPGVFARAEIEMPLLDGSAEKTVVAVPEGAVHTVAGEAVVFVSVAGEPGTFAKRVVRVGTAVHGLIPIADGLAEGEEFVAAGGFVLKAALSNASVSHAH